jgi:hypothetical protein
MHIGCAVPAPAVCGAGLAAVAPLARAREREGDLSHPGNRGFFLWLKALGGVGAYRCTEFSPKSAVLVS